MKCPHCKNSIHIEFYYADLKYDKEYQWYVKHANCPACENKIIFLSIDYHPPTLLCIPNQKQ